MTHAAIDPVARQTAGLVDGLLRLSAGIEALEDLQADLAAGLKRAGVQPVAPSRVGLSNSLVHGREFRIYTPKDQSDRSVFLEYIL